MVSVQLCQFHCKSPDKLVLSIACYSLLMHFQDKNWHFMYVDIYKHIFRPKFPCRLQRECSVFQLLLIMVTCKSSSEFTFKYLLRKLLNIFGLHFHNQLNWLKLYESNAKAMLFWKSHGKGKTVGFYMIM